MNFLTISGSNRPESSNVRLLHSLETLIPQHQFIHYNNISLLPLFQAEKDKSPWHHEVIKWRNMIEKSDAVIISTPEYIHNIPASLKNALEWVTSSGELTGKRVLPITFTPHPPRGEKAMQSLIWSLGALNANIITQIQIYQSEITFDSKGRIGGEEIRMILQEAIKMMAA